MTFRLRTLGRLDLCDASGREVHAILAQPKRLGLLVYLATAAPGAFIRRDVLLALFWPELSTQHARNALRQAVHQLRKSLGEQVVLARGADAIAIDSAQLECDATLFENAIRLGSFDDTLVLYEGDFAPGLSIDGSRELNDWVDETRRRLRRQATRAAWTLAEQHERAGRLSIAAHAARRAASLANDEMNLRHLMALLDRVGDSGGALEAYDDFARRLQRDVGEEPGIEMRRLAEALRERRVNPIVATPTPDGPPQGRRDACVTATFENLTGDSVNDYVGRLIRDSVARGLTETRLLDVVVDHGIAVSEKNEASYAVSGWYTLADDCWRVQGMVRALPSGRVLATVDDATSSRSRPWDTADTIARRITAAISSRLDPRSSSMASATHQPPDVQAQRDLGFGMELHLRGEYRAAIPHFLRAAGPDAAFAFPILWALQASVNLGEYEQAEAIVEDLKTKRRALSPVEQLGCDYFAATLAGDRTATLKFARTASELVPESEILSQVGREALFSNQPRLALEMLKRLDPERGWIPAWTPYWRRLTEAYHMLGDHSHELAAAQRGREQHPEAISTLAYEACACAALGDSAGVLRCIDDAEARSGDRFANAGDVLLAAGQELRAHGNPQDAALVFTRAAAWWRQWVRSDDTDPSRRFALGWALYEARELDESQRIFESLPFDGPAGVDVIGARGVIAAHLGDDARAAEASAQLASLRTRFVFGRNQLWVARIASLRGDVQTGVTSMRRAFARGHCHGIELHRDHHLDNLRRDRSFVELTRPR